jgi:glucokinase
VPVRVDNDANAAALAETRWGSGPRISLRLYATIGTGIGRACADGQHLSRSPGAAGEGGHVRSTTADRGVVAAN